MGLFDHYLIEWQWTKAETNIIEKCKLLLGLPDKSPCSIIFPQYSDDSHLMKLPPRKLFPRTVAARAFHRVITTVT